VHLSYTNRGAVSTRISLGHAGHFVDAVPRCRSTTLLPGNEQAISRAKKLAKSAEICLADRSDYLEYPGAPATEDA
jgi:hypothetical protein